MKTTKYILSALSLAALAAGCTKDNAMRNATSTPLVEGLRISVSTATPSTRTVLHENGLTVMWEKGDQLQLLSPTDSKAYLLDLDESTLSSDGTQADFVASEAIPEGEYYLASSNAVLYRNATPNKIAFSFDDDPNNESARSYITVTDANRNTHEGGLKTMALLSDEIYRFGGCHRDFGPVGALQHFAGTAHTPHLQYHRDGCKVEQDIFKIISGFLHKTIHEGHRHISIFQ